MTEKCLDLERQNLKIVGVKERKEDGKDLFQQVLHLDERPKLDRAHRALRIRLGSGAPPRQLILKLHHASVLEDIM